MTTVATALADARRRGVASLDAQLLLARLLATTRTRLIAHDERALTPVESARWEDWLERRLAGEPVAYLLGEKEFHGLALEVDRSVLVPRPETELLVDWACEAVAALASERSRGGDHGPIRVVDLGTGSGAIALALKRAHPQSDVTGTDVSAGALAVARRNAERLGLAIELVEASWWQGLEGRRFDIAIANPPYIAADDPHLADAPARAGGRPDARRRRPGRAAGDRRRRRRRRSSRAAGSSSSTASTRPPPCASCSPAPVSPRSETRRDLAGHERATGGRRPSS